MLDLIPGLNATQGRIVVMVLHHLNQACRYADHVVALKSGRIAAEGPPEQVVTEHAVADVFGLAARVVPDPVTGHVPVSAGQHGGHRSAELGPPLRRDTSRLA